MISADLGADSSPGLLATKLFVPRAHPDLVARPRLIARVIEGLSRKLTLVCAPPGSGKTTLLLEWRSTPYGQKVPLGWLTVDERDNDPNRFLSYLVAAFESVVPGAGDGVWSLLRSNQHFELDYLLIQLLNNLYGESKDFALVIDDYHVISNEYIHQGIDYLLAHLPDHVHLIITSRADPPLSLARLRASGDLTEIRSEDLRFTRDEIVALLNEISGLNVAADAIAVLEERTEGWAAGIHLAALSIRDRDDATAFISTFSGEHRYVGDYLVEEVLQRQSEESQEFLLTTSVLDRFNAELCAELTGRTDAQDVIESLESRNLFVIALDDQRHWYRYHQLFGELLRQRLNQRSPGATRRLDKRAAHWFAENGLEGEAIQYALRAEDWEYAAELVDAAASAMLNSGQIETLLQWLHSLPEDVRRQRPKLSAFCVWALLSSGRIAEVEEYVSEIEECAADAGRPSDERQLLRGVAAAGRASMAVHVHDYRRTIELADEALALLPEELPIARATTLYSRGFALGLTGRIKEAGESFIAATEYVHRTGSVPFYLITRTALGQYRLHALRLREAEDIFRDSLKFAAHHGLENWPYVGFIHICLGRVLYERGDTESAREETLRGIDLARNWSTMAFQIEGYFNLALMALADGDLDATRSSLEGARELVPMTGRNPQHERVRAYCALIDLFAGNKWSARAWAAPYLEDVPDEFEVLWSWWPVYRAALRILGDTGDEVEAQRVAEKLYRIASDSGWMWNALQMRVALARTAWQAGERERALVELEEALEIAEPEGVVQVFVLGGTAIREILNKLRARSPRHDFIDLIETGFSGETVPSSSQVTVVNDQLAEPLSEREMEVLQLIALGRTNAQIADELYVAVGTIKTHAHNIYGKLGVRSRTQAVARSRELGLVEN